MKRSLYKITTFFILTLLACIPLLGCKIVVTEHQLEDIGNQIGEEIKQQLNEQASEQVDEALEELEDIFSTPGEDEISQAWNYPFFPMSAVSQAFAGREYKEDYYHLGADIPKKEGTAVKAIFAGTVISSAEKGDNGYVIVIEHSLEDKTFYSAYCHLQPESIEMTKEGDIVGSGEKIVLCGNTGNSERSHLHLSVFDSEISDPYGYMPAEGTDYSGSGWLDYKGVRFFDPIEVVKTRGNLILENYK